MLVGPSKCLKHIQHTGVKNPNLLEANQLVIERFHSGVQHLCKFINKRKSLHKKRVQFLSGLIWNTKMAAISLCWNTNMAAMTSCENTLFTSVVKDWTHEDWKQIQLAFGGWGLDLAASKLQIQCSKRSAASCNNVAFIDECEWQLLRDKVLHVVIQ